MTESFIHHAPSFSSEGSNMLLEPVFSFPSGFHPGFDLSSTCHWAQLAFMSHSISEGTTLAVQSACNAPKQLARHCHVLIG